MSISFLKSTFIAGVLVLVPIVFLAYLGGQLFLTVRSVLAPLVKIFPIEGILVWILINLAAVLSVLLICFLAGLLVRVSFIAGYFERLDTLMSNRVPGYALAKGIVGDVVRNDDVIETHRPVIVDMVNCQRLAFEVERTEDGRAVVFLPNSPSAQSGSVMVVPGDTVRPVDIPRLKAIELMQFHGMGLGALLDGSGEAGPGADADRSDG